MEHLPESTDELFPPPLPEWYPRPSEMDEVVNLELERAAAIANGYRLTPAERQEIADAPMPLLPAISDRLNDRQQSFLQELHLVPTPSQAAKALGIAMSTVHRWKTNPEFLAAYEEAREHYKASIEEAIHDRAINGLEEDIYYMGRVVGQKRNFSDALLMFLAKRHIPEYRDKQTVTLERGSTTDFMDQFRALPPEKRAQLTSILEELEHGAAERSGEGQKSIEGSGERVVLRRVHGADVADCGAGAEAGEGKGAQCGD